MFKINTEKSRTRCIKDLSDKRKSLINGGVTVDGICLLADDKSHANMNGYVSESIINGLIDVTWKCGDGTRHVYTVQDLKPVFKEITTFRRACFIVEDVLLTQIENAVDPASVDIGSGWPANILITV
jgi:hypothetical protein